MRESTDICPLCDRPLGRRREAHHLIPKARGGTETVWLHPICHRKIHSLFDNATLARTHHRLDTLRQDGDIAAFTRWLRGKPPDFHRRTAPRRGGRRG
ncbi:HNH endonuclease signature motif containing protein [Yunchengibacter salinarum]|uniref:HNH endonuclease signature motif containing protein n=1 Tax=Yunchengibacter salinarum TaxID=3133399 RepID=UPI0035B5E32A